MPLCQLASEFNMPTINRCIFELCSLADFQQCVIQYTYIDLPSNFISFFILPSNIYEYPYSVLQYLIYYIFLLYFIASHCYVLTTPDLTCRFPSLYVPEDFVKIEVNQHAEILESYKNNQYVTQNSYFYAAVYTRILFTSLIFNE